MAALQSPTLNMIEPLWKELKRRVWRVTAPWTIPELLAAGHRAWAELPQSMIDCTCDGFFVAKLRVCLALLVPGTAEKLAIFGDYDSFFWHAIARGVAYSQGVW